MNVIRPPAMAPDLTEYHWFDTCPGCPQCDLPIHYAIEPNASPATLSLAGNITGEAKRDAAEAVLAGDNVAVVPPGVL